MITDCQEAAWLEEEVKGDVCWRTRPGHGRSYQRMVPTSHQENIQWKLW